MGSNPIKNHVNIKEIIANEDIITYFHPVISVKKKSVIGFEALARGFDRNSSQIIMPNCLFDLAQANNMSLELDRVCRKVALNSFKPINSHDQKLILFLNFDTSILDEGIVGSGHLQNLVKSLHISPENIALEIVESKVKNIAALKKFIDIHREKGFLIALDDVGNGYSNLNRIPLSKPDILKIDRYLVKNIDKNYHKRAVFKSLVNLSRNIGALVIAEGVERVEEAITTLELGVDMIQGFYFSKPSPIHIDEIANYGVGVSRLASGFQNHLVKKLKIDKLDQEKNDRIIKDLISHLAQISAGNFDQVLMQAIHKYPNLECVYVLKESGIQVSSTVCSLHWGTRSQMPIFRPAPRGEDHSLKDYYYSLVNTGLNKYTTEPYISLSSGNLCSTISMRFANIDKTMFILCADFHQVI